MTVESFRKSAQNDESPPSELTPELEALWFAKAGRWEEAHNIAQDIPSKMGAWIHGLLHAIEGDFGNAGYWYDRAAEPAVAAEGIDAEWERIVRANLS
ncbi:MAG: hypothetical protein WD342_20650 [Verrucomicrobiales bacterium]